MPSSRAFRVVLAKARTCSVAFCLGSLPYTHVKSVASCVIFSIRRESEVQRFGNVKLTHSGGSCGGGGGGVCLCVHTCVRERNLFKMLKGLCHRAWLWVCLPSLHSYFC